MNRLRRWAIPLGLTLLCTALQALPARAALQYQRAALLHGQWWRLLTGSLVHLGWGHLIHDLAGLWLIWLLFGHQLRTRTWLALLLCDALAIGLGLFLGSPQVRWYVGISALLYGLFTAGCLATWRTRPGYASLLLAGMLALVGWSLWIGPLPAEDWGVGGPVLPVAHAYGVLGAALFMLGRWTWLGARAAGRAGDA